MGVARGCAVGVLAVLLFLTLVIFGVAYTVNATLLNPGFITKQIDRVDVSGLAGDVLATETGQTDFPPAARDTLVQTIDDVEPEVKERLGVVIESVGGYLRGSRTDLDVAAVLGDTFLTPAFVDGVLQRVDAVDLAEALLAPDLPEDIRQAVIDTIADNEATIKARAAAATDPVFRYLLGESDSIDLAVALRSTLLSTDLAVSLIEGLGLAEQAAELLAEQVLSNLPARVTYTQIEVQILVNTLTPAVEQAIAESADEILDYLVGLQPGLSVEISLPELSDELKAAMAVALADILPPGWNDLTPAEQDEYLEGLVSQLPTTLEIDEATFGDDLPLQVRDALDEAERSLAMAREDLGESIAEAERSAEEARPYVGYSLQGYYALMALMALLVLGIALLSRDVAGSTRTLGIIALVYGALHTVGILMGRSFIPDAIYAPAGTEGMPEAALRLLEQIAFDVAGVLQALSIGMLVLGAILIAVSVVYPRLRAKGAD